MKASLAPLAAAVVAAFAAGGALACGGPNPAAVQAATIATPKATIATLEQEGILRAQPANEVGSAVTSYLGLSLAQIRRGLRSGDSLYDVAVAQHRSPAELVAVIVRVHRAKMDESVARGTLTVAQERALLAKLTSRVAAAVNGMITAD